MKEVATQVFGVFPHFSSRVLNDGIAVKNLENRQEMLQHIISGNNSLRLLFSRLHAPIAHFSGVAHHFWLLSLWPNSRFLGCKTLRPMILDQVLRFFFRTFWVPFFGY